MVSDRVRVLTVGAFGLLAVGLAAATLDSAVVSIPNATATNTSTPLLGDGAGGDPLRLVVRLPCIRLLAHPLVIGGALLFFIGGTAALYRRRGILTSVAFLLGLGSPYIALSALLTDCQARTFLVSGFSLRPFLWGETPSGSASQPLVPAPVVFFLLGVALLLAVSFLFARTSSEPPPADEPEGEGRTPREQSGGGAVDRGGTPPPPENEVYRAWAALAESVDVWHRDSTTPGEFADAAVEADFDPRAVTELTSLFETVRYGGQPITPEREERARALREELGLGGEP